MLFLVSIFFACGPTTLPAGAVCTEGDTCEEGMACLPFSQFSGDSCEDVATVCSLSCVSDEDCASLGDDYLCFATCDGDSTCGQTGSGS